MTREERAEAIRFFETMLELESSIKDVNFRYSKLALEALEQEPCEDAISRQELLKAISTWDKFGCDADTKLVPYKDHYVPYIHYDDVINCIKGMPSVTSQPCEDVVSRQAAIRIAEQGQVQGYEWQFKELIKLPPVTPQQKMGHWEWNQYDANPKIGNFHCSLCHSIGRTYFDFCPYCGAKMSEIPTGAEGSDKE